MVPCDSGVITSLFVTGGNGASLSPLGVGGGVLTVSP